MNRVGNLCSRRGFSPRRARDALPRKLIDRETTTLMYIRKERESDYRSSVYFFIFLSWFSRGARKTVDKNIGRFGRGVWGGPRIGREQPQRRANTFQFLFLFFSTIFRNTRTDIFNPFSSLASYSTPYTSIVALLRRKFSITLSLSRTNKV